ncbi:hypothetical protein VTI74DRAFT_2535 [Chaetomium olivicolor]
MASVGPQLPPHLQKRKRTPEDDGELGSPPPKTSRRDNEDEIPLDDDSDDDYGPSAPGSAKNATKDDRRSQPPPTIGPSLPSTVAATTAAAPTENKRSIGPSLPVTLAPINDNEIPLDDSDSDATGPAPPRATAGPAAPPPAKRVLGPAPPPAPLSERPSTGPNSNTDSDSDDDWGPALPGSTPSTSSRPAGPSLSSSTLQPEPSTTAPKRDDWMLAPPPNSNTARAPDPTKLKARKFASGPRAATEAKPAGISSIWTETPEEKARRLANAVLGREDPNVAAQPSASRLSRPEGDSRNSKRDEARIKSYTEQTRGRSLVEEHQAARAAGKTASYQKGDGNKWGAKGGAEEDDEDDPSKRAFDWEKDMKVGGRISGAQRRELMNRAANFGGRFQSGKYL